MEEQLAVGAHTSLDVYIFWSVFQGSAVLQVHVLAVGLHKQRSAWVHVCVFLA